MITDNQLIHRQYLCSEVWRAKRTEAISFYGATCSRCGQYGTDVHHKTYERVGGAELMSDLEIMCRGCHEAHHAAERSCGHRSKKTQKRKLNRLAVVRLLTPRQKRAICEEFSIPWGDAYLKIVGVHGGPVLARAEQMLGRRSIGGLADKKVQSKPTEEQRTEMIEFLAGNGVRRKSLALEPYKTIKAWYKGIKRGRDKLTLVGKRHLEPDPEAS